MSVVRAVSPIEVGTGLVIGSMAPCDIATVTKTDSLGIWADCDHCDRKKFYSWKYAKRYVLKIQADS